MNWTNTINPIYVLVAALLELFATPLSALTADNLSIQINLDQGQDSKICTVILRNDSTHGIRLTNVDTGCNCIEHDLQKADLAPSEKGELYLIFDFGLISGENTHKISVKYRDLPSGNDDNGDNKERTLEIKATTHIRRFINISTNVVSWSREQAAENLEKKVVVTVERDQDTTIIGIEGEAETNIKKTAEYSSDRRSVTITLSLIDPGKPSRETITITTDSHTKALRRIDVFCRAGPP